MVAWLSGLRAGRRWAKATYQAVTPHVMPTYQDSTKVVMAKPAIPTGDRVGDRRGARPRRRPCRRLTSARLYQGRPLDVMAK